MEGSTQGSMPRRAARELLRRTVGLWPVWEVRHKALGWPDALATARTERREVQRLRAEVEVPEALVTTVIATYRRPESLLRAVRSALDQTVTDQVVVVVDDGGGLPDLPADPRLVAVSLAHNVARAGVVRNVGIALARSPHVAFLDDDNVWRPHHLAAALEALGAGADLVYTAVERVRPDGTRLDVVSRPFDRRALAESHFVDTNAIVVRRRRGLRFSRLSRSSPTVAGEDWELVRRLSGPGRRWRVRHVPEVTVTYLVNPESYFTRWEGAVEGDAADPTGTATAGAR